MNLPLNTDLTGKIAVVTGAGGVLCSLFAKAIARCGANVVSVHHDRGDVNMAINSCFLKLGLETRDKAQIEQIKEELTRAGFHLVSERV